MRRSFIFLLLSSALFLSASCGGNSNTSGGNTSRDEMDTTVNSERIDSSNMAPTGGPGPEPEGTGTKSSGNTNESKADNKNKTDNKAENKNKNSQ